MSVYPAGVKHYFRNELTVADGTVTAINHHCVVKSISAAPMSDFAKGHPHATIIFDVFDGTSLVLRMSGSVGPNMNNANMDILIPADGIRINDSLKIKCTAINQQSVSGSQLMHSDISVLYQ